MTAPERIYLQGAADAPDCEDPNSGVTWCWHQIDDTDVEYVRADIAARATAEQSEPAPVEMVLYCPNCGTQHIDAPDDRTPDWSNPPHRSHLCHECGAIWRPADVATVGVESMQTEGKADTWPNGIPGDARAASAITARDSVTEQCAKVCEAVYHQPSREFLLSAAGRIRALKSQQDAAIPFRPWYEILDELKTNPKLLANIEQAVAASKQSIAQLEHERTVTREQLNTPLDAARSIESQRSGDGS